MSNLKFHWFLPTNGGDGRQVVGGGHGVDAGPSGRPGRRSPTSGRSPAGAEDVGFEAALTPTGAWCEDAWLSTAMLSQVSERLKFLVAFRPGLVSPFLAAQMAGTFQNLSGGRLLLNVVTGGESHEQRMYGDFLDKEARYARCDEFLDDRAPAVDRRDGRLPGRAPPGRGRRRWPRSPTRSRRSTSAARPRPPAGSPPSTPTSTSPGASRPRRSPRRSTGSASSPPTEGRERPLRHPAAHHHPRHLRGGLGRGRPAARGHRPTRPSRRSRPGCGRSESEGQRRMLELQRRQQGRPRDLPEPVGRRRPGPRRRRHRAGRQPRGGRRPDRGVRTRSASTSSCSPAYPHLEEAYWFGEGVLPILASAVSGSTRHRHAPSRAPVPFARRGSEGRRHDRPRRRRRRQPQAGVAHPRGRDPRRPRADRLSPTSSSTSPRSVRRCSTGPTRTWPSWSQQVGEADLVVVGQPDLQGHLHRAAQAVPRPVRGRHRPAWRRRTPDARCRPHPRPRAGAHAATGAGRARRRPPSAASTSSTPDTTTRLRTPTGWTPTGRP